MPKLRYDMECLGELGDHDRLDDVGIAEKKIIDEEFGLFFENGWFYICNETAGENGQYYDFDMYFPMMELMERLRLHMRKE